MITAYALSTIIATIAGLASAQDGHPARTVIFIVLAFVFAALFGRATNVRARAIDDAMRRHPAGGRGNL